MGMSTIAVLDEGQISHWPEVIRKAAKAYAPGENARRAGKFHYGHILGRAKTSEDLLVTVHGNTGGTLEGALRQAQGSKTELERLLHEMRTLLTGHGYFVRRPGRSRGEGPFVWGYSEKLKAGQLTPPDTNPVSMLTRAGLAVILHNDLTHEWPEEIQIAMTSASTGGRKDTFEYGKILSVSFSDDTAIAGIRGASGQGLSPERFIDNRFLWEISALLRAHGHAVRAPGEKDYAEPLQAPVGTE